MASGAILAEMLAALLMVMIGVSSLLGAMLSLPRQQKATKNWALANLCVNSVTEELRNYVKPEAFTEAIPAAPMDTSVDPPIPWHLRGDTCADCWALAPGNHDGTQAMLPQCRAPPFSATLTYTVAVVSVNGLSTRKVDARIEWQTPGL